MCNSSYSGFTICFSLQCITMCRYFKEYNYPLKRYRAAKDKEVNPRNHHILPKTFLYIPPFIYNTSILLHSYPSISLYSDQNNKKGKLPQEQLLTEY